MALPTLHRIDPELYDRMVASGVLDGQPVELVDGLLVLRGGDTLPSPLDGIAEIAVSDLFAVLDGE